MPQFYTLLTDTGQAKLANAVALGGTIEITELAVGDGGGSLPTPDSSATALINEVRRAAINTSDTDPDNPSWIVVEQVLPPDVGGWTIREIGIYDVDGDLIGIGSYPETYKPVLAEGSSRTQTVRFVLEVSDTGAVTLKVDPSVVLATREYVDQERTEHEQSRNHPPATTSAQGMVEKATTAEAKSGAADKFPDAAGVHEAFNQFGLGGAASLLPTYDIDDHGTPSGIYYAKESYDAGTFPPGLAYCHLIVSRESSGTSVAQYACSNGGNRIFQRTGLGEPNTWTDWVEIYHSGVLYQIRASQDETDTGDEDDKFVTPKKLKAWVKQATESVMGLLKVATQAQVDAGTDDTTAVTPKKLKAWVKQATESVMGLLKVATQAQVDAGTDDTTAVTPKKLKAWVKQATESVMGQLKVATQAQVDAGTDDATAVTPKKLRFGFSISKGSSGYITFPSWLGSLIVQWGGFNGGAYNGDGSNQLYKVTYPIAFPNGVFSVVSVGAGSLAANGGTSYTTESATDTDFFYAFSSIASHGGTPGKFIAIGH